MVIPIGSVTLHAQPTLKEVIEDTAKKSEEVEIDVATMEGAPEDEFNRGVPRTTVQGFFLAVRERDFEKAAEYLDLRHLPEEVKKIPGAELAREFRIVLARTLWVDVGELSLDPEGHDNDGLPPYRDRIGRIKAESKTFDILLQKVPRGDGVSIWKFSNKTIAQVPEMYAMFGHEFLDEVLPPGFFEIRFFEIYLGEWVAILAIVLMAYLVAVGLTTPLYYWMRKKETLLSSQLLKIFRRPFRLLIRYILVEVRKMFYAHPKMLPSPARIRFEGFGEHSLDLQVFAFLDVTNPDNFTEVAEDLNLRIMDIVAKAGTEFAIPAQAVYVQRGKGLDETKAQIADGEVQDWINRDALFIPKFPQGKIEELQGTLDYPPKGSPDAVHRAGNP